MQSQDPDEASLFSLHVVQHSWKIREQIKCSESKPNANEGLENCRYLSIYFAFVSPLNQTNTIFKAQM